MLEAIDMERGVIMGGPGKLESYGHQINHLGDRERAYEAGS